MVEEQQILTEDRTNTSSIEVLVGYNGLYNFQTCGDDPRTLSEVLSTTGWGKSDFYQAGQMVADRMYKLNVVNPVINNGQTYEIVYDIPEAEADALIRMRADDPFFSGERPAHHFEKVNCRALLPEQLEVFRNGLEYQLQVLQGKVSEAPKKENQRDSLTLYLKTANYGRQEIARIRKSFGRADNSCP
ncbi:MAG: hypothetical protein AABW51_02590 [Nanoarchaeota archaeon]